MPNIHQIFTFHHIDKEIVQLYSSHTIRRFTLALICIFEPIYLFIHFNHSFSKILLFYAAISLIYGLFVPFGAKIMAKLGLKKAMLWSVPFIFLYYLVLWQINSFFLLIFLAIILRVIYGLFYWPAYHTDVARFSKRKTRGEQMSVATIVYSIVSVIAPFLGGSVLFIIVLILLFVSAVPLLFSKEIREVYTDSYERAFKQILSKKARRDSIAFGAFGFDAGVGMFIWPIFMFVLVINYELMGIITSGALFLSLLFALYIGELADVKRKKLLRIGSVITAIAWLFKTFVTTPFNAFLAHTAYRFAATSSGIPPLYCFSGNGS
jgi:MFS family permease